MPQIYSFWRDKFSFPTIILVLACIVGIFHFFSYLIPLTDDAFVVTNVQAVAADVAGYITKIYVHNGEHVKKGQPLFKVFDTPYKLALAKAKSNYEEELAHINVIQQETKKNEALLKMSIADLHKKQFEYNLKKNQTVNQAISQLEIKNLSYDVESLTNQEHALSQQLIIDDKQIVQAKKKAYALKAIWDNAKVNVALTTVRAGSNGIVDNMYLSVGTPIIQHQPLFSLINTDSWYVQANFNETDLRYARPGDKVIVVLRMYYFQKIFHGVIVNHVWAADRQNTNPRSQQQVVVNVNEWLNLPQRFPLQVKILDPDPRYPLHPGASAYVYIRTGTHR
jgi:multidrug resistance efflux pump